MRSRGPLLLIVALALVTCTRAAVQPLNAPKASAAPAPRAPADLLLLSSRSGLTALDPSTGVVRFNGPTVSSLTGGTTVFTATVANGDTILQAQDAATGTIQSTAPPVPGVLSIRAASADGTRVALMAPLPAGSAPWTPQRRATTDLVVADATGQTQPMRFHLEGNFEPEAFASDGASLFMISYVPPTDPDAYRVVRLDLSDGDLYPVFGRDKSPVDTMTGTRLLQMASPNGTMLFTLYTEQPPAYATGYDKTEAAAGQPVAFVHTLNLDQGFAICVSLPKALWGGNPLNEALAVSPDSRWLYVVDTARGVVTTLDADALKVARRVEVAFGPRSPDQARATVSPDGRSLLVAYGEALVVLDTATLQPDRIWMMGDTVSGLGFSADGLRLYVAMPGRVAVVDPSTGRETRTIAAPGVQGIRFVETLSA